MLDRNMLHRYINIKPKRGGDSMLFAVIYGFVIFNACVVGTHWPGM